MEEQFEGERIVPINIENHMKTSYIDYSMSVIVARALPDVRDGLKPVHRRILYGMLDMGVLSNRPYKKSAKVVGEVLGKYHPHGDSSVYNAMVRLAQDWNMRYPLIDGQGNFGSIDADPPAAMRYTEARLRKLAEEMLVDLDKETVSRIEVLDSPTFQFAETAQNLIDRNSNSELLGISTISANESIKLETVLSCSHVKQQASILLAKANNYLQGTYRLANSVRDMLDESQVEEEIMLPVMFVESVLNSENKEVKILGIDEEFTPSGESIDSQLRSKFMSKDVEWDDMKTKDLEMVISYLNADVQSGQMEERTLKTMLGLLNDQAIQTIKA